MPRARPTFIWRKSATPVWLEKNEAHLFAIIDGGFAIIERPGKKRLMLEAICRTRAAATRLEKTCGGHIETLPRDWFNLFTRPTARKPMRIGRRLLIVESAESSRQKMSPRALVIPSGAAFGTGDHATTAMSLRLLEKVTRRLTSGWRMLDAGTGSGILALAGHRFGAAAVTALENDPLALATARANARRNRIRGVEFIEGDVLADLRGRFELITANLYSELLVAALPGLRKSLRPDGRLILSGVMRQQEPSLARALRTSGFAVSETRRRGKWIALLAQPSR